MKKNTAIIVLAIYSVLASTMWVINDVKAHKESANYAKEIELRKSWETDARLLMDASAAIEEFCDSTCDTGEMDEFIQSPAGHLFWYNWQQVLRNNE